MDSAHNEASKVVTAYLRHGGQDKRYNVHTTDGYVRVAVLIQLPEMKRLKIDHRVLELILMSNNPRIMTNGSGDRVRLSRATPSSGSTSTSCAKTLTPLKNMSTTHCGSVGVPLTSWFSSLLTRITWTSGEE